MGNWKQRMGKLREVISLWARLKSRWCWRFWSGGSHNPPGCLLTCDSASRFSRFVSGRCGGLEREPGTGTQRRGGRPTSVMTPIDALGQLTAPLWTSCLSLRAPAHINFSLIKRNCPLLKKKVAIRVGHRVPSVREMCAPYSLTTSPRAPFLLPCLCP